MTKESAKNALLEDLERFKNHLEQIANSDDVGISESEEKLLLRKCEVLIDLVEDLQLTERDEEIEDSEDEDVFTILNKISNRSGRTARDPITKAAKRVMSSGTYNDGCGGSSSYDSCGSSWSSHSSGCGSSHSSGC